MPRNSQPSKRSSKLESKRPIRPAKPGQTGIKITITEDGVIIEHRGRTKRLELEEKSICPLPHPIGGNDQLYLLNRGLSLKDWARWRAAIPESESTSPCGNPPAISGFHLLQDFAGRINVAVFLGPDELNKSAHQRLSLEAAGFQKREEHQIQDYLLAARLRDWYPDTSYRRHLIGLLRKHDWLREGRKGSKTNTRVVNVGNKGYPVYGIRRRQILQFPRDDWDD